MTEVVEVLGSSADADTHRAPAESNAQRQATAHYGDPCLYCQKAADEVDVGPCPARAGNRAGQRIEYRMSEADFGGIVEAVTKARLTPVIAINCGMPRSPQEIANEQWCALGKRLGFDGMSVEPSGKGPRVFTAVADATTAPEAVSPGIAAGDEHQSPTTREGADR